MECESCVQAKLVSKLDDRVFKLETKFDEMVTKVSELEKNGAVSEEQTKMVFKMLAEIKDSITLFKLETKDSISSLSKDTKDSISSLSTQLTSIQLEPANNWKDAMKEIVKNIISGLIGGGIAYLFLHK